MLSLFCACLCQTFFLLLFEFFSDLCDEYDASSRMMRTTRCMRVGVDPAPASSTDAADGKNLSSLFHWPMCTGALPYSVVLLFDSSIHFAPFSLAFSQLKMFSKTFILFFLFIALFFLCFIIPVFFY